MKKQDELNNLGERAYSCVSTEQPVKRKKAKCHYSEIEGRPRCYRIKLVDIETDELLKQCVVLEDTLMTWDFCQNEIEYFAKENKILIID